jgi:hypothetical protein
METLVKSYLAAKENDRLKARDMAIYIAHLLGRNSSGRRRVFEAVIEGFNLRNKVVHGNRARLAPDDESLWKFSSILRQAIRKVMTLGPNVTRKKIEDLVL